LNSEPFPAEETLTAGTSSVVRERGSKRQPNVSTRHIRGLHNHCGLAYHAAAEAISGGSCDAASGVSVALVPWAEEAACASSARATRANGAADRRGRPEPAATAAAPSAPGALAAPKPAWVFAASPGLSAEEARAKADREGGFPAQGIPRPTLAFPLPLPFPAFQRSPAFPFPFAHLRSPVPAGLTEPGRALGAPHGRSAVSPHLPFPFPFLWARGSAVSPHLPPAGPAPPPAEAASEDSGPAADDPAALTPPTPPAAGPEAADEEAETRRGDPQQHRVEALLAKHAARGQPDAAGLRWLL
jgi:hypothetical protein